MQPGLLKQFKTKLQNTKSYRRHSIMTSQSLKKIIFKLNQDMEDYPPLEFESLWGIQIKPHTYKVDNIPYYIYGIVNDFNAIAYVFGKYA